MIFANLKGFDERKGKEHSSSAVIQRLRGRLMGIQGALVVPFNPPAVQGLGQFGGFPFELEDLGRNSFQSIAGTANKLAAQRKSSQKKVGPFSHLTAEDP